MEQIMEYGKTYQEYRKELDAELSRTAEGFVRIGYLLKVARDTDILKESGYANVTDFAKAEYGIDRTQVSRFIRINDRFSEGGYADHLKEHYRGFGYAKLTIMLQLPDGINEEITPDYSKAEIQAIKEEVDEEKRTTDIELALEGGTGSTADTEDDLGKTVKQLGEDDPEMYADIWEASRQQGWGIPKLQEIMAPTGQEIYSVRIRGVGRKELIVRDADNGNMIKTVILRTGEKKCHSWKEMLETWQAITAGEDGTGSRGAWETTYCATWPLEEKVAPVQQPKRKSKVQRAKVPGKPGKGPGTETERGTAAGQQELQIPGQTSIEKDFPKYMPQTGGSAQEKRENTENMQMDSRTAAARRKEWIGMARSSAEDVVRYAEMGLYSAARQQMKELEKCLQEMEQLPDVKPGIQGDR